MSNIWQELKKPFFVLAPMDDVTDTVFRQMVATLAPPNLYFTEFVSVDGLQSEGREALLNKLRFSRHEKPIIAQLWGLRPKNYQKTATEIVEMGFSGVDINMGCPDRTVVKNGCCSALINNRPLAKNIIKATKLGLNGKLPLSVKTRTGFGKIDLSWHDFLLSQGLEALTVHGRTVKEMSRTINNWEAINDIRKLRDKISPNTVFVGNGDINSYSEGVKLAKKYNLDGVMIGRGVFKDPYVFSPNSKWSSLQPAEKLKLYLKHLELFNKTWNSAKNPVGLKKFAKVYISDFDGAAAIRSELMNCSNVITMIDVLSSTLKLLQHLDT